jgi:hypothetical protein
VTPANSPGRGSGLNLNEPLVPQDSMKKVALAEAQCRVGRTWAGLGLELAFDTCSGM